MPLTYRIQGQAIFASPPPNLQWAKPIEEFERELEELMERYCVDDVWARRHPSDAKPAPASGREGDGDE